MEEVFAQFRADWGRPLLPAREQRESVLRQSSALLTAEREELREYELDPRYKERLAKLGGLIFVAAEKYYLIPDPRVVQYSGRKGVLLYDEVLQHSKFVYADFISDVLIKDGNLRVMTLLPPTERKLVRGDNEFGVRYADVVIEERSPGKNIVLVYYDYHHRVFLTNELSRMPGVRVHPFEVPTIVLDVPYQVESGPEYSEDVNTEISPVSRAEKLNFLRKTSYDNKAPYSRRVFSRVRQELVSLGGTALTQPIENYTFTLDRRIVLIPLEDLTFETYKQQMLTDPSLQLAYISPEMGDKLKVKKTTLTNFLTENRISTEIATHYIASLTAAANISTVYSSGMLHPVILEDKNTRFHRGHMLTVASELLAHRNDTVVSHYGNITSFRFSFDLEDAPDEMGERWGVSEPITTEIFIRDILKRIFSNRLPSHNIVKFTVKQRAFLAFTVDAADSHDYATRNMTSSVHLFSATADFTTKRVVLHGLAAVGNYERDPVGYRVCKGAEYIVEDNTEPEGEVWRMRDKFNPLTVEVGIPGALRVFEFNSTNFYKVFAEHFRYPERLADTPYFDVDPMKIKGDEIASSSEYVFGLFNRSVFKPNQALERLSVYRTRVQALPEVEVNAYYLSTVVGTTEGQTEDALAKQLAAARQVGLRYSAPVGADVAKQKYTICTGLRCAAFTDGLIIVFRSLSRDNDCVLCAIQLSIWFAAAFKEKTGRTSMINSIKNYATSKGFTTFDMTGILRFIKLATDDKVRCQVFNERLELLGQSTPPDTAAAAAAQEVPDERPLIRLLLYGNHCYYIEKLPPSLEERGESTEEIDADTQFNIIVYCDFETVNKQRKGETLVYSYSYAVNDREPQYYLHSGDIDETVVLDHFIRSVFDDLTLKPPSLAPIAVWFKAWNGARFDYRLLISYLLSLPSIQPVNFVGLTLNMTMKYWELKYTHDALDEDEKFVSREFRLIFTDPKLFTTGLSLTKAVIKFSKLTPATFAGLRLGKDEFSHKLIQERYNSTGGRTIPLTEAEKEQARSYNIQDVALLRAVCKSLNLVFKGSIYSRSIPGYAFKLLKESLPEQSLPDLEGKYASNVIIRKAIVGGRVEACRGVYCTGNRALYGALLQYSVRDDPLYMLDVNALYPFSCIGKQLPQLDGFELRTNQVEFPKPETVLNWLIDGKMFITEMTVIGYTDLAQTLPPLIPTRFDAAGVKLDVIDWTKWGKKDHICSNILGVLLKRKVIDLSKCVFGETILFPCCSPVLSDFMSERRDERIKAKQAGDDALAQFNKDVSNSLIGKLMQKKQPSEDKFLLDGKNYQDFTPIETFQYETENGDLRDRILARFDIKGRKFDPIPCQLGCFVLSYAREYMWDTFIRHCGKLGDKYFYTDTDSLLVTKEMYEKFKQDGLLDDTAYGKLKVEFIATEAIIHAKKTYMLSNEDGTNLKYSLKGFSHTISTFDALLTDGKTYKLYCDPAPIAESGVEQDEAEEEEQSEGQEEEQEKQEEQEQEQEQEEQEESTEVGEQEVKYTPADLLKELFYCLLRDDVVGVAIPSVGFQGFKTLAQVETVKVLK
jgi:hypothetical protein